MCKYNSSGFYVFLSPLAYRKTAQQRVLGWRSRTERGRRKKSAGQADPSPGSLAPFQLRVELHNVTNSCNKLGD